VREKKKKNEVSFYFPNKKGKFGEANVTSSTMLASGRKALRKCFVSAAAKKKN
jgi:hypothetical protein